MVDVGYVYLYKLWSMVYVYIEADWYQRWGMDGEKQVKGDKGIFPAKDNWSWGVNSGMHQHLHSYC
jgi:hypothetical protein